MGSRRCFFSWIVVVVTLGRAEPWRSGNEVTLILPPVQFRIRSGYRLLPLLDAKSPEKSILFGIRPFRRNGMLLAQRFSAGWSCKTHASRRDAVNYADAAASPP